MRLSLVGVAIGLLSSSAIVTAQTYTDCNPLQKTCPPDPALGRSVTYDFTKGSSPDFKPVGSPTYDSNNGAAFSVAKQGDAPLIQSNWYMMFGHVEFVIKTAPGKGIVSSAVLQSDDLDEIDWEWLGANNLYVQTNYFGKGDTGSYNRGAAHDNAGNQDGFHTYTIDWTSTQIVWQIDGKTVRVLTAESAGDHFPQSPMMVKVGVWAGGDPNNAPGTIQWAGGETDYSAGPYTMYLKSLVATDYSTGKSYTYSDKSGSWRSITSDGGQINGNSDAESISTVESAPPVTATIDSAPIPFSGTHRETSSFVTPSIWPWVPKPTTLSSSVAKDTTLPSGWTFSGSRQVQPPSAASSTPPCTSSSLVSSLASPSHSGLKTSSISSVPNSSSATKSTGHLASTATYQISTYDSTLPSFSASIAHVAPTVAAANDLLEAPLGMGVFCALLGGLIAIF
ncbi:hypothetical protein KXV71_008674 [Aspergillus fumigatus]|uniref:Crh-like protein 4 n=1 Tax=Aspergillus fumigatus (strain ATCC MYA-4609 / CBS 101355 / FGSC A1100 / Af293) TaxID=330879 RepID=CRH4_ASPFU|nr:cell wall glucanase, putative [Aspergillus fumigatus Af293]EAL88702.1 cell wall glucanase, putative [Aspergillus fumigatus Af293]KAH1284760.1 hypothetical protein KXX48_001537 [Aspergillus fumigatus]KAH2472505.1 hypothetical protein KXV71_008674 [Aspergillus fumigatus]KAH3152306.1 hypothetical protein KXV34_001995 [Aspergillus fumigatus]